MNQPTLTCHPERSEGPLNRRDPTTVSVARFFARPESFRGKLRMTTVEGLSGDS